MQTNFMGVIFTNHAIERLYQRGVTQSDAWYTLKHPETSSSGQTPDSWKFSRSYGNQRIEVIGKLNEKREWVVLSCWAKEQGNNQPIFPLHENLLEKLIRKLLQKLERKLLKNRQQV